MDHGWPLGGFPLVELDEAGLGGLTRGSQRSVVCPLSWTLLPHPGSLSNGTYPLQMARPPAAFGAEELANPPR